MDRINHPPHPIRMAPGVNSQARAGLSSLTPWMFGTGTRPFEVWCVDTNGRPRHRGVNLGHQWYAKAIQIAVAAKVTARCVSSGNRWGGPGRRQKEIQRRANRGIVVGNRILMYRGEVKNGSDGPRDFERT